MENNKKQQDSVPESKSIQEDNNVELEFLKLDVNEKEETIARLTKEKEELKAIIEKLNEQLKGFVQGSISFASGDPVKPSIPESVEVDDVHYKFLKPAFSINGRVYTAHEAACDQNVLKAVLAIDGQNILQELV